MMSNQTLEQLLNNLELVDSFESIKSISAVFFTESFEALEHVEKQGYFEKAIRGISRIIHNKFMILKPTIIHIDESVLTSSSIKKVPFLNLAETVDVETIPDLSVKWADYAEFFHSNIKYITSLKHDVIQPFTKYTKELIRYPELSNSLSSRLGHIDKGDFDNVQRTMVSMLSRKNGSRTAKLGEVVGSTHELYVIVQVVNKLMHEYIKDDRKSVIADVDSLDKYLSEWKPTGFTEQFTKDMSNLVYHVAERVEFYSVYGHRLEQFALNLDRSVKIIKKAI